MLTLVSRAIVVNCQFYLLLLHMKREIESFHAVMLCKCHPSVTFLQLLLLFPIFFSKHQFQTLACNWMQNICSKSEMKVILTLSQLRKKTTEVFVCKNMLQSIFIPSIHAIPIATYFFPSHYNIECVIFCSATKWIFVYAQLITIWVVIYRKHFSMHLFCSVILLIKTNEQFNQFLHFTIHFHKHTTFNNTVCNALPFANVHV